MSGQANLLLLQLREQPEPPGVQVHALGSESTILILESINLLPQGKIVRLQMNLVTQRASNRIASPGAPGLAL